MCHSRAAPGGVKGAGRRGAVVARLAAAAPPGPRGGAGPAAARPPRTGTGPGHRPVPDQPRPVPGQLNHRALGTDRYRVSPASQPTLERSGLRHSGCGAAGDSDWRAG